MRISLPAKISDPTTIRPEGLTDKAFARLRKPAFRGSFVDLDAARAQLGLLVARNGEAKLYWLINLEANVVQEAKFLSFGQTESVPISDAFCELAKGKRLEDACALPLSRIEELLRDDPSQPAFGTRGLKPLEFLNDLQIKLKENRPAVVLLPKPEEKLVYKRKEMDQMNEADRNWLPLGLMKKLEKAQAVLHGEVAERLKMSPKELEITGLHDDLIIELKFHKQMDPGQMPTVLGMAQEVFSSNLHPEIVTREAQQ